MLQHAVLSRTRTYFLLCGTKFEQAFALKSSESCIIFMDTIVLGSVVGGAIHRMTFSDITL